MDKLVLSCKKTVEKKSLALEKSLVFDGAAIKYQILGNLRKGN